MLRARTERKRLKEEEKETTATLQQQLLPLLGRLALPHPLRGYILYTYM